MKTASLYPEPLRRVAFYDAEHKRRLLFLTNNLALPALTIAGLYKSRWQIELLFKWIKQHLRIKAFFSTSDNAVKARIWIVISVYVLVAIVKEELGVQRSLYEILQVLSLTMFEKTPLLQALQAEWSASEQDADRNQSKLFHL
jgi:IS4 transposase